MDAKFDNKYKPADKTDVKTNFKPQDKTNFKPYVKPVGK